MSEQNNIWEYLRGNRTGRQANRFERAMLSDPFLYEAVEGLSSVEADHEKVVQLLQERLRKQRKSTLRKLYRWIVAASLLLLAGTAVFFMNKDADRLQPTTVADSEDRCRDEKVLGSDTVLMLAVQTVRKDSQPFPVEYPSRLQPANQTGKKSRGIAVAEDSLDPEAIRKEVEVTEEKAVIPVMGKADSSYRSAVGFIRTPQLSSRALTPLQKTEASAEKEGRERRRRTKLEKEGSHSSDSLPSGKALKKERRMKTIRQRDRESIGKKYRKEKKTDDAAWRQRFQKYVADSLRYPEDALKGKIEGQVELSVRLNRKGVPGRIKLLKRLSPACNREAIRLVEEYPGTWIQTENEILLIIPFYLPATR